MVSIVNVPLVQLCILLLQVVVGLEGWLAAAVAITVLTGPAYMMTRAWVWPEAERAHRTLVALFWAVSILGLLGSSIVTYVLATQIDAVWVANLATLGVYGVLFVARFLLFDRLLGDS